MSRVLLMDHVDPVWIQRLLSRLRLQTWFNQPAVAIQLHFVCVEVNVSSFVLKSAEVEV